jgi:8-oxo-dGTP pyrophosphatase MutT (NUDIX family)
VSRARGKGWIVPKGSIGEGERPRDAAIREAEEEAGLRGIVARRRVGRYRHENGDGSYLVDVYLMRVTRVLDEWDEDRFRRRRWLRAEDAAARLRAELQAFVERLERTLGSQR